MNGCCDEKWCVQYTSLANYIQSQSKPNATLFRIQDLSIWHSLHKIHHHPFWKEAVSLAILVKCISCCTNIVQKFALHVAKKCRQQFELEKVETYCNIYNGYSFSRQQPLENTESENASFLDVHMRPLYFCSDNRTEFCKWVIALWNAG